MATKLTLPSRRFVARVNTGTPEAKANYKALAQRNALALEECPWGEVTDEAVKPSLVEHDFTATFSDEKYDAFCMTGSYNSAENTEVAYAGMVAYRFTLPQDYLTGSATLVAASVMLSRDRFLLPGLRVSAVLSNSAVPSTSWDVVRGDAEGCVKLAEQLANPAERITAAEQATDAVEVGLTGLDSDKKAYLWIYLTVEDYTATWTWYSSTQHRLYAIEGSGMIISQSSTVEFSEDVDPGSPSGEAISFPVVTGGVAPAIVSGSPVHARTHSVRLDANLVVGPDGLPMPVAAASRANAAAALSRLYAGFYAGSDELATLVEGQWNAQTGAKFNVSAVADDVMLPDAGYPVPVDVLRLETSVLVLPFAWPRGHAPSRISLSFPAIELSPGARFNVLLAPSDYLPALTAEQLKAPGLYDGTTPPQPLRLLGSVEGGSSALFEVPQGAGLVGTLVVAGWLPPEAYDLAAGGSQGTGAPFFPDVYITAL